MSGRHLVDPELVAMLGQALGKRRQDIVIVTGERFFQEIVFQRSHF